MAPPRALCRCSPDRLVQSAAKPELPDVERVRVRVREHGAEAGPYEVVGLLGAGGMGEVYRARDTRLGRDVALKILSAEYARSADRLRRFEQEARLAGSP